MTAKCEKCFWNYNCPMADGDDDNLTEEDYKYIEECKKFQE